MKVPTQVIMIEKQAHWKVRQDIESNFCCNSVIFSVLSCPKVG